MSGRRIVLVDTAPVGQQGSMSRYADLVQRAIGADISTRVRVSLPVGVSDCLGPRLGTWVQHVWRLTMGRHILARQQADVFHVLDGSHAYIAAHLDPAKCVVTCHDLIPRLQADGAIPGRRPGHAAKWVMERSMRGLARACHVVADSENTRRDAVRLAGVQPDRSSVVPVALAPDWLQDGMASRQTSPPPVILHIGNNAAYKNRAGVLRVFAIVRRTMDARLLLVGPRDSGLQRMADQMGISQSMEWRSCVPESELKDIYRSSSLLLFPSIYEGFGWPVLEAMACGCPVVCSNAASLPEVAGPAALMSPPGDESALAGHCVEVLTNQAAREKLRLAGLENATRFTMERMADGLRKAYATCGS